MAVPAEDALLVEPLSASRVRSLFEPVTPPCLSLYMPTHRSVPDNTVDLPAYRHLVEALELALSATPSGSSSDRLLRPFRLLEADRRFWEHTRDGLAVLAAAGRARVFVLQRPVQPLAMVAGRFHTLPLVRAVTALDRCDVLALTSRQARVFSGRIWHDPQGATPERLDPVPLVPAAGRPAAEALGRDDVVSPETSEPHRVKHGTGPTGRAGTAFVHGGFGAKRDDVDRDTEIFLRHVDGIVHEQVSRRTELPLVLVCQGRLAASFRGLTANPLLLDEHVDLDPHLLSAAELAAAVVPAFVRGRDARIAREIGAFVAARDRGLGAGDLADVARAAVAGQVAMLLVEADRLVAGRLDRSTGAIEFDGLAAGGEDLYDAIAETVLAKGGTVVTVARGSLPTAGGVAAIYRYA
ncbi:MAG: hypothetical protein ACKON7_07955 [Planctomycetaceae bacterium]